MADESSLVGCWPGPNRGRRWKDPLKLPGSQLRPWFLDSAHPNLPSAGFVVSLFIKFSSPFCACFLQCRQHQSAPGPAKCSLRFGQLKPGEEDAAGLSPFHHHAQLCFSMDLSRKCWNDSANPSTYLLFILIISRVAMIMFKR